MQLHQHVNYLLLGSQESMLRDMFEKKKSPFYHFGMVMNIDRIPHDEFQRFLTERLAEQTPFASILAEEILSVTKAHPYYTQQLAYTVWEKLRTEPYHASMVENAVDYLTRMRDLDYERLWVNLNITDRKMLIGLSASNLTPLSAEFSRLFDLGASSTTYSALKRLLSQGLVIQLGKNHIIDDPFFEIWIRKKRSISAT
jgi:hypothetical protein